MFSFSTAATSRAIVYHSEGYHQPDRQTDKQAEGETERDGEKVFMYVWMCCSRTDSISPGNFFKPNFTKISFNDGEITPCVCVCVCMCVRPVIRGQRIVGPLHIKVTFRLTLLFKELSMKTHLKQFWIRRNGLIVNDANLVVGGFLSEQ